MEKNRNVKVLLVDEDVKLPPIRLLSTEDNPYNPFLEWNDWLAFDEQHGYNTCGLLARFAFSSDELSELDQGLAINAAIDSILQLNPTGNYVAITEKTFEKQKGLIA